MVGEPVSSPATGALVSVREQRTFQKTTQLFPDHPFFGRAPASDLFRHKLIPTPMLRSPLRQLNQARAVCAQARSGLILLNYVR